MALSSQAAQKKWSSEDVLDFVLPSQPRAKMMTIADLAKFDRIQETFSLGNPIILLYVHYKTDRAQTGHWCLLLRNPHDPKVIEFYDSYGLEPDEVLEKYTAEWRQESGQHAWLSNLLTRFLDEDPDHQILMQEHVLQTKTTNTCGPHVALRAAHASIPLQKFQDLIRDEAKRRKIHPDQLVLELVS